ncbi:MAG: glucose-1-phosphate adenylyltransferase [Lachnospiraceae bacterium]|nr:glucose-1-phosphate adenylyltransferase [Lachnospiraceae bacterium]
MIAMLLAGGQGSRLGALTQGMAKPAVAFGGKYRIIDFPLSNCVNSGVDTVGVLTQYRPLQLNTHIGIGIPWDLDKQVGGVTILPPYEKSGDSEWYTGTANAIYQNMEFMEQYNPDYVLILSGDHIYKMDYEEMLTRHKKTGAEATIAVMPVPWEEASRYGIVIADEEGHITEFEEKPANPRSNLASMGIYIFNFQSLRSALEELAHVPGCDFGMHVIPHLFRKNNRLYTFEFNSYWKDVGTLGTYWEANMELTDLVPEFNLYEEFWQIYTASEAYPPAFISRDATVQSSLVGDGSSVEGTVIHSVLGANVRIEAGALVKDCVLMNGVVIEAGAEVDKAIVAEGAVIGRNAKVGVGSFALSRLDPRVYNSDITVIGAGGSVPEGVSVGRNVAIIGRTEAADYPQGSLESGAYIIKKGVRS